LCAVWATLKKVWQRAKNTETTATIHFVGMYVTTTSDQWDEFMHLHALVMPAGAKTAT
jgi:hypothetical protein